MSNLRLNVAEKFVVKVAAGVSTKDQSLSPVSGSGLGGKGPNQAKIKTRSSRTGIVIAAIGDLHWCLDTSWITPGVYTGWGANHMP